MKRRSQENEKGKADEGWTSKGKEREEEKMGERRNKISDGQEESRRKEEEREWTHRTCV